jgi:hypothetical protein
MMTQNSKIIAHIKKAGGITQRDALLDYSIQSLTRRITELRDAGHDIVSVDKKHPTTNQKYTEYRFAA